MSRENNLFRRVDVWLQALSKRERLMVVAALFLVPIYLFIQLIYLPSAQQQKKMSAQFASIKQQNAALQEQLVELSSAVTVDPNAQQQQQIARVQQEISQFDKTLQESVAGMVPPQRMAQLLREMLQQRADLTLVSLKNIAPQPLVTLAAAAEENSKTSNRQESADKNSEIADTVADITLYRHGIELQFSGSYMATVKYFSSLQQLPQRLFWEAVRIENEKYPQAQVRVNLYTLSPEKGWISG
ncbi:MAG: type II secretion system protein GspM [Desulfuromonas sp.]|nr:type II secretion system protein GspM [Desulfuromonas sp.]